MEIYSLINYTFAYRVVSSRYPLNAFARLCSVVFCALSLSVGFVLFAPHSVRFERANQTDVSPIRVTCCRQRESHSLLPSPSLLLQPLKTQMSCE